MKKIFFPLIVIFLSIFSLAAQVNPQAPLELDPAVRTGKLANGMSYYIRHNEKPANRAEYYIITNIGAIQETPAQDGLAHFQEHMCLNGTKNFPGKGIIEAFQNHGLEFGRNINASTGVEQTMYMFNNIPTTENLIDTTLQCMRDISAYVIDSDKEVNDERGIIVEERRTRRTASWRMHEKELAYLYKGSKYATCTLIGSKENLETFDPEEIRKFYKTWYRPDLQAVVVVGDIDVDAMEQKIKDVFSEIPARVDPQPKDVHIVPDNEEPIVAVLTDPEATSHNTTIYFKSKPLPKEYRGYGVFVLQNLVKNIMSSIINERLEDISTKPNAPFLSAQVGYNSLTSTLEAFMGAVSSKSGEETQALKALMVEIHKAKKFGFTQAEYNRAKTNLLRSYEYQKDNASSRENADFVYGYMYNFLFGFPYCTPEYMYNTVKQYLEAIPLAQFNQIMGQIDLSKNEVIIYKGPKKDGEVVPTKEDLLNAVAQAADADIKAPVAEKDYGPLVDTTVLTVSPIVKEKDGKFGSKVLTLKNGIKVILKHTEFDKEQISLNLKTKGGMSVLPTEDLPSFESNVFSIYTSFSGLSDFDANTLSKMLTGKVASVSPFIGESNQGFVGSAAPKDFETMLQLLYLNYTAPRFVKSEFDAGFNKLKAVVPNIVKQPSYIFKNKFTKVLQGNSPRVMILDEEMLEKVNFETIEKDYKKLFASADGATVRIIGNYDEATIRPLLEKYLGSLPTDIKALKPIKRDLANKKGYINDEFKIEMKTPKTSAGIVYTGKVKYNLKNLILADMSKYVLDLIYTKTVREEEGGTYGVGTAAWLSKKPDQKMYMLMQFDMDPSKSSKLINLTIDGFEKLVAEGPTSEQFEQAQKNLIKNISENRIQNSYWINCLNEYYTNGIDVDTKYKETVESITASDIQKFLSKLEKQKNRIKIVMEPTALEEKAE